MVFSEGDKFPAAKFNKQKKKCGEISSGEIGHSENHVPKFNAAKIP